MLIDNDLMRHGLFTARHPSGGHHLTRIIHERFYCNRGFAALARETSFLTRPKKRAYGV